MSTTLTICILMHCEIVLIDSSSTREIFYCPVNKRCELFNVHPKCESVMDGGACLRSCAAGTL